MGFPGYFLVVSDLCSHARSVGIRVGPGRGSAAGSLVSYALGITALDPIKHGLLFERFLNPERISMPDIDGLSVLRQINQSIGDIQVIMLTASEDVSYAVTAINLGAVDYVTKNDPEISTRINTSVLNAIEKRKAIKKPEQYFIRYYLKINFPLADHHG